MNYFNSTFQIKGDAAKNLTPSLLRKARPKRRGGILRAGKRTKAWETTRAKLKVEYQAKGITECELGYDGCKRDDWLSFAHGRKRRHLVGDELATLTILACTPCHARIEALPEAAMLAIVQSVISERGL